MPRGRNIRAFLKQKDSQILVYPNCGEGTRGSFYDIPRYLITKVSGNPVSEIENAPFFAYT